MVFEEATRRLLRRPKWKIPLLDPAGRGRWRDEWFGRLDEAGWPTRDAAASEEDDEALDTRLPLFVTGESFSGRFVGFKDPDAASEEDG